MHPRAGLVVILISAFGIAILLLGNGELVLETTIGQPDSHPPVAVATILEDQGKYWTNMSIKFSSSNSIYYYHGGPLSFIWDFGDGSEQSTLANPIHVYEHPGAYTVTLTVIDEKGAHDSASFEMFVQYNYGDTGIVLKAVDGLHATRAFQDPEPGQLVYVAVKGGGWVGYLCKLREGQGITVTVHVPGDRPVDVYLFREVDFQIYRDGPRLDQVRSEAKGLGKNVTGEFTYIFRADAEGRYYVVIDNMDMPPGTNTEGPVDYNISIESLRPEPEPDPPRERILLIACLFGLIILVAVLLFNLRRSLKD